MTPTTSPIGRRNLDWLIAPLLPILLVILGALILRPWGNFPINDDWQYAHIAEQFANTGEIKIDRPIAPTLIVQTILGGAAIKLFGFSHSMLRLLTFVLFLVTLVVIDSILRIAKLGAWRRAVVLLLVAFNPIGLATGLSFMTEVFGTLPALIAIRIWMGAAPGRAPSLRRALFAIIFGCLAYLSRQFSGLVVPALCISLFVLKLFERIEDGWPTVLTICGAGALVLMGTIVTHWLWTRATLNEPPELNRPLASLVNWKGASFAIMGSCAVIYLTGFIAPLLALLPRPRWQRLLVNVTLIVFAIVAFRFGIAKYNKRHPDTKTLAVHMPFLTNILSPEGIGPYTTTDMYIERAYSAPKLPKLTWQTVEYALYVLLLLWALADEGIRRLRDADRQRVALFVIGTMFCVLSLMASLQTYGFEFFDRYLWTPFIGLALGISCLLPDEIGSKRARASFAVALLAPIMFFSVAALHDNFTYQRTRWAVYRMLLDRGISPLSIDAGYEPNGWFAYDGFKSNQKSVSCVADCKCRAKAAWFCHDDSYRIGSVPRVGDIVLERVAMKFWLMRPANLVASRRPDP